MTTTRSKQWLTVVLEHDPEHYETPDVYGFSNGRTFKSTDKTSHGVYRTSDVLFDGVSVTFGGEEVIW